MCRKPHERSGLTSGTVILLVNAWKKSPSICHMVTVAGLVRSANEGAACGASGSSEAERRDLVSTTFSEWLKEDRLGGLGS